MLNPVPQYLGLGGAAIGANADVPVAAVAFGSVVAGVDSFGAVVQADCTASMAIARTVGTERAFIIWIISNIKRTHSNVVREIRQRIPMIIIGTRPIPAFSFSRNR